jgi:hypothetical protein
MLIAFSIIQKLIRIYPYENESFTLLTCYIVVLLFEEAKSPLANPLICGSCHQLNRP